VAAASLGRWERIACRLGSTSRVLDPVVCGVQWDAELAMQRSPRAAAGALVGDPHEFNQLGICWASPWS
jgi:hypothetical protein